MHTCSASNIRAFSAIKYDISNFKKKLLRLFLSSRLSLRGRTSRPRHPAQNMGLASGYAIKKNRIEIHQ